MFNKINRKLDGTKLKPILLNGDINLNNLTLKSRLNNKNKFLSLNLMDKKQANPRKLNNNKVNFNVPKIHVSDAEDNIIYTSSDTNENLSDLESEHKNKIEKKIIHKSESESEDEDVLEMEPTDAHIDRYLSIADIPEATLFASKFNTYDDINEEEEEDEIENSEKKFDEFKIDFKTIKPDEKNFNEKTTKTSPRELKTQLYFEDKKKKKIKAYHDGSGIPLEAKAEIIRSILKDFNLEEQVQKYTASDIAEIKLDQHNPDIRPVRERLLRLMKSDVIRINDVKYMRELSKKLQESYIEEQQKLMEYLEEKERLRERKLRLQGLIQDEKEDEYKEKLEAIKAKRSTKTSSGLAKSQSTSIEATSLEIVTALTKSTKRQTTADDKKSSFEESQHSVSERTKDFVNLILYEPSTELGAVLLDETEQNLVESQNKINTMFTPLEDSIKQELSENENEKSYLKVN